MRIEALRKLNFLPSPPVNDSSSHLRSPLITVDPAWECLFNQQEKVWYFVNKNDNSKMIWTPPEVVGWEILLYNNRPYYWKKGYPSQYAVPLPTDSSTK